MNNLRGVDNPEPDDDETTQKERLAALLGVRPCDINIVHVASERPLPIM